jgi:hypothetical protein
MVNFICLIYHWPSWEPSYQQPFSPLTWLALSERSSYSIFQSQAVASSRGLLLESCHLPHPLARGSSGGWGKLPSHVQRRWRGRSSPVAAAVAAAELTRGGGGGRGGAPPPPPPPPPRARGGGGGGGGRGRPPPPPPPEPMLAVLAVAAVAGASSPELAVARGRSGGRGRSSPANAVMPRAAEQEQLPPWHEEEDEPWLAAFQQSVECLVKCQREWRGGKVIISKPDSNQTQSSILM